MTQMVAPTAAATPAAGHDSATRRGRGRAATEGQETPPRPGSMGIGWSRQRGRARGHRGGMVGRIDRIAEPWGTRTPYGPGETWPTRVDTYLADGLTEEDVDRWVQSASILHSNGDALDIAVKDGRIVGVRGRARGPGQPRPARPEGPLRLAGQPLARPADPAADPPGRRARRDRLGHRDGRRRRPHRRSCWTSRGPAPSASTPPASCSSRSTTRSALIAHGGHRHQPRRRQHPAVHGHRRRGAQGVLRLRRPARLLHRHRPRRRHRALRPQRGRDPDGAVDAHPRPAGRRRTRPQLICVDPRPHPGGARRRPCTWRPRPGTNVAADERAAARDRRATAGSTTTTSTRTRSASTSSRSRSRDYPPELAARDLRRARRATSARPRGSSARPSGCSPPCCRASTSRTRPPRRPCQVNNLHLLRGMLGRPGCGILQMNGQPTAQNTRECGADGDLPGFRNWDNDGHVADLARVWNVDPMQIPHYGAADPRDADLPLRRGGLDPLALGHRHQPGGVAAGARRGSARSSARSGSSSSCRTSS